MIAENIGPGANGVSKPTAGHTIETVGELLACALSIESDALARYRGLARRMLELKNHSLVELFNMLATQEQEHAANIRARIRQLRLGSVPAAPLHSLSVRTFEAIPHHLVNEVTTPVEALLLARSGERASREFFGQIAATASSAELRKLAAELTAEQVEHENMIERVIAAHRDGQQL